MTALTAGPRFVKFRTRSSAIAVIAYRTTCIILTLFIVIATSRPLNKKSVRCQSADPTITADLRPQSAVRTDCSPTVHGTVSLLTNEPTPMHTCSLNPHRHLWRFSNFLPLFFVVHFVAKRYTLQQIVSKGTNRNMCARNTLVQLLAAYTNTNPESHNAHRHRQTDGRTIGWCQ